jgi:hypothetical protein
MTLQERITANEQQGLITSHCELGVLATELLTVIRVLEEHCNLRLKVNAKDKRTTRASRRAKRWGQMEYIESEIIPLLTYLRSRFDDESNWSDENGMQLADLALDDRIEYQTPSQM